MRSPAGPRRLCLSTLPSPADPHDPVRYGDPVARPVVALPAKSLQLCRDARPSFSKDQPSIFDRRHDRDQTFRSKQSRLELKTFQDLCASEEISFVISETATPCHQD